MTASETVVAHSQGPWSRNYGKSPMRPEDEWYIFGPDAAELLGAAKAFLAAMDDDRIRKLCIGLDIDIYTLSARLIDAITKAEGRDS